MSNEKKVDLLAAATAAAASKSAAPKSESPKSDKPKTEAAEPVADIEPIADADFAGLAAEPVSDPTPEDVLPGEEDDADEPVAEPVALVVPEVKAKPVAEAPKYVFFVSRDPELRCFPINHVRSAWYEGSHRLIWRVPVAEVNGFRNHPHVQAGRVVEKE